MKRIILLGASGLLGYAIKKVFNCIHNIDLIPITRKEIDFLKVYRRKDLSLLLPKFDLIVNAMAFTNTQLCEKHVFKSEHLNGSCLKELSLLANDNKAKLIHISTDYVFDGAKKGLYLESDKTTPRSQYGKSKLLGETYIKEISNNFVIIRSSSLYGPSTNKQSFIDKVMEKAVIDRNVRVVADQYMSPTFTIELAKFIKTLCFIKDLSNDIFHFSDKGYCSWYDLTKHLIDITKLNINLIPCKLKDYQSTFERPKNTSLSTEKAECIYKIETWKTNINTYFKKFINY